MIQKGGARNQYSSDSVGLFSPLVQISGLMNEPRVIEIVTEFLCKCCVHNGREQWMSLGACSGSSNSKAIGTWRLDIKNDDGLIGPFMSRGEAERDAKETLGIKDGEEG